MRFPTEDQLVTSLAAELPSLWPAFDRFEGEVPSRLGIADLVAARTDRARLERRSASGLDAVVLPGALQLLVALADDCVNEIELFARAGVQRAYGRRLLRRLAGSGHVEVRGDGWVRADGLLDPYETLIAIEAKLMDWKRALSQAVRYSYYADMSYVALPSAKAEYVDLVPFRSFGVGLISVGAGAEIILAAPVSTRTEAWRRLYVAEVLTARVR